jgi:5'-phosphate synthase pdxT subunit
VFGTCAGAILLAKEVTNPAQASLGLLDLTVQRNGYGRQIDSHISKLPFAGGELEAVFIRAPIIRRAGEGVTVLAWYRGDPVWVEQGPYMATTFHPELTDDERVHRRFLEKVAAAAPAQ